MTVVMRKLLMTRTGEEVLERMPGFVCNVQSFKRGGVFISSWRKFFALGLHRAFSHKYAGVLDSECDHQTLPLL